MITFATTAFNEQFRNNYAWLFECIEPALRHPGIAEIVVYDDGSEYPEGLEQALPILPKLKIIHGKENKGVFAAKLESVAHSRGDWVITMDSDNHMDYDVLDMLVALPKQADTWYLPSFAMPAFDFRSLCGDWDIKNIHEFIDLPLAECCLNTGNQTVNRNAYMNVFEHLRNAKMSREFGATDSLQINMHWLYSSGHLKCLEDFQYHHRVGTGLASNYIRAGEIKLQYSLMLLGWLKQTSLDKNK